MLTTGVMIILIVAASISVTSYINRMEEERNFERLYEEAAKGVHITDRETDIVYKDTYVVRHYVPVERDGETVAMLYGVIVLGGLPERVNLNPYGGMDALYIIDGVTGDFLIDTWHPGVTGNILALGEREMAPGYNSEQLRQGVPNGESRYVVFVSKNIGEYLYFYYQPMSINNWRIAVSVPESVVFENTNAIARLLNVFLAFELACFVIYFIWMTRYVRDVTDDKQKRLDMINHMYNIEQLLFNAHEKEENVYAALEKLGGIVSAEKISFWILEAYGENQLYLWEAGKTSENHREFNGQYVDKMLKFFADGNEVYQSSYENEIREILPLDKIPEIYNRCARKQCRRAHLRNSRGL